MKSNFKPDTSKNYKEIETEESKELSKEEFENYILKSGAKGSFMIYRSEKNDDELGIDEL